MASQTRTPEAQQSGANMAESVAIGTQANPDIMEYIKTAADAVSALRTAFVTRGGRLNGEAGLATGIDYSVAEKLLKRTFRDVLFLRNVSRPFMRLPSEVLCRIFQLLQEGCLEMPSPPSLPSPPRSPKMFSWMTVLQVCQHWNGVAKSFPSLWCNIVADCRPELVLLPLGVFERYITLFLPLSGNAPLKVSVDGTRLWGFQGQGSESVLRLVRLRTDRIEELHLSHIPEPPPLVEAARGLRILSLSDFAHVIERQSNIVLFGGDLSSVRSLALDNVRISSSKNFPTNYRCLQQLCLSSDLGPDLLTGILFALSETPRLEDLMFAKMHIYPLKHQQQRTLLILPRLKRLVLDRVEDVHNLFDFLGLPDCVFVTVKNSPYKDGWILPDDPLRFSGFREIKKMKLVYPRNETDSGELFALSTSSALQADLDARPDKPFDKRARNIMGSVEELWIKGAYDSRPHGMLYGRCYTQFNMPKLRRLVLDVDIEDGYHLWSCLEGFIPDAGDPCNCPLLELLEIRVWAITKDLIKQLWELLLVRMRRGCRVRKLRMGTFVRGLGGDDEPIDELTYLQQQEEAQEELSPLVDEFEFVDDEPLPTMGTVPICTTRSAGAWQWPPWDDL